MASPRIKVNLNGADELSFTVTKHVENGVAARYDELIDYSVVFVQGFGYFEVSPTVTDNSNTIKTLSGSSLGETELGQLHCTLECNTELDYQTNGYTPTILYSAEHSDKSLIHRILTYAPTYEVGEVDDTIAGLQRMFSFQNEDIISCFSKIAEEINCIFDVEVTRDEDGNVVRKVNIYDAQYCKKCGKRHIINGICDDCKSTDIGGIGEDTTILISTENLSNEISLTPDGNMKNCFIVEGGDDLITNTISGYLPSKTNKIYMFPEETKNQWSRELREKYDKFETSLAEHEERYGKLLELEYHIFDLILYLQSGRMPTIETAKRDLHEETEHVISQYKENFPNGLGMTEETQNVKSRNGTVRQVFAKFVDEGYAVKYENGAYKDGVWTGQLIIYQIQNIDVQATIDVRADGSTITYSDDIENPVSNSMTVHFKLDYEAYIKQMILLDTENYEYIQEEGYNNSKDWQNYSLNRLYSYDSGYETCIETLTELKNETELETLKTLIDGDSEHKGIMETYNDRRKEISWYMNRLTDFIYYLYMYFGGYEYSSPAVPSSQDINYNEYKPKVFRTLEEALENMVHYIRYGTFAGESEEEITDHPLYCSYCNSTNVTLNGCSNCGRPDTVITYGTLAQTVFNAYRQNPINIESQRNAISDQFILKDVLGDTLYKEFFSYVKEDIYTNSNFISDGLGNTEIINHVKELVLKAKQELAKSCVSQHTLSGDVHSFVAYSELNKEDFPIQNAYDKFVLGNFMRYICDGKTYKLRLSSEEFSWNDEGCQLNVEFTDVIQYLGGGISDIASLVQAVGNIATTANTAKTQSEKGVETSKEFQKIKDEGLQSTLSNVLSARNIDVQIDDKGILLRKYDYDLEDYSGYQMKLVNRNIVMTENNWEDAKLAIGHGKYNGEYRYGVWADVLVGDVIAGNNLCIYGGGKDGTKDEATVVIDGNGITLDGGAIRWKSPIDSSWVSGFDDFKNAVTGTLGVTNITSTSVISPRIGGGYLCIANDNYSVEIDPKNQAGTKTLDNYLFCIRNKSGNSRIMSVNTDGEGYFKGKIYATEGQFSGSIDCGNGKFVVDKNGKLSASGGITFENDLVSWNGTSLFENSRDSFSIQQGDKDGNNPVVKLRIITDETYIAGSNMRITGDEITLGTFHAIDNQTRILPRIRIPDYNQDNGIYIYKDGYQFMNLVSPYDYSNSTLGYETRLNNLELRIEKYGCMVIIYGVLHANSSSLGGNKWVATLASGIRPIGHSIFFSPSSYSGGGQSGQLNPDGSLYIATTVEGDVYFNFSYTV